MEATEGGNGVGVFNESNRRLAAMYEQELVLMATMDTIKPSLTAFTVMPFQTVAFKSLLRGSAN